jgi:hypothetical protein
MLNCGEFQGMKVAASGAMDGRPGDANDSATAVEIPHVDDGAEPAPRWVGQLAATFRADDCHHDTGREQVRVSHATFHSAVIHLWPVILQQIESSCRTIAAHFGAEVIVPDEPERESRPVGHGDWVMQLTWTGGRHASRFIAWIQESTRTLHRLTIGVGTTTTHHAWTIDVLETGAVVIGDDGQPVTDFGEFLLRPWITRMLATHRRYSSD